MKLRNMLTGMAMVGALASVLAAQEVSLGGKKAKTPSGWREEPPVNSLRYAQFTLPKVDGDDADATLVVFKHLFGSIDDNVDRCKKAFARGVDAKVTEYSGPLGKGKMLDATGTYLHKSRLFDPDAKAEEKPGYTMIDLYIKGDREYHIRLIGPTQTVAKHRKAFEGWLTSFH